MGILNIFAVGGFDNKAVAHTGIAVAVGSLAFLLKHLILRADAVVQTPGAALAGTAVVFTAGVFGIDGTFADGVDGLVCAGDIDACVSRTVRLIHFFTAWDGPVIGFCCISGGDECRYKGQYHAQCQKC